MDQSAGVRVKADVLVALAQYRRRGGKVHFGVLLAADFVAGEKVAGEIDALCPKPQSDASHARHSMQGLHGECGVVTGLTILHVGDAVKPCKQPA